MPKVLFLDSENFPFVDTSSSEHEITNTGVSRDLVTYKVGSASMNFGVAAGRLEVTNHTNLALLSGEAFTFDLWIYPTALATSREWVFTAGDGLNRWFLTLDYGAIDFKRGTGSTTSTNILTTSESYLTENAWSHIAITKTEADFFTLYVNGVSRDTNTWVGDKIPTVNTTIGQMYDGRYAFSGNMDNIRLTKGEVLWTEDFELTDEALFYGPAPVQEASSLYDIGSRGNLRGKCKQGWIRPTLKQFFTTKDFEEVPR